MDQEPPKTITVIVNKDAGTVLKSGSTDFAARIRDGLNTRGMKADVHLTHGRDIATRVRTLVSSFGKTQHELRTVVVGGGDGTVGSVASILAGTDVALGILPLGTLNHFAKDLGLPQDLEGSLDIIAAGQVQLVDVAEVNGRVFVNNSSIGIYPFLVEERVAEQKRRGVGKLAAIFPALARTLRASSWQLVTISAEGTLRAVRTPCVFVGNNFYDLAVFGRRKDLSSGELCVYIVKQQTWLGLGLLPFKIAFGVSHREHDVELLRVQTLSLQSSRGDLLVATDGESAREIPPLVYRIRPKALRVLAPPASNLDPSGQRLMPATKASTGSKLP